MWAHQFLFEAKTIGRIFPTMSVNTPNSFHHLTVSTQWERQPVTTVYLLHLLGNVKTQPSGSTGTQLQTTKTSDKQGEFGLFSYWRKGIKIGWVMKRTGISGHHFGLSAKKQRTAQQRPLTKVTKPLDKKFLRCDWNCRSKRHNQFLSFSCAAAPSSLVSSHSAAHRPPPQTFLLYSDISLILKNSILNIYSTATISTNGIIYVLISVNS